MLKVFRRSPATTGVDGSGASEAAPRVASRTRIGLAGLATAALLLLVVSQLAQGKEVIGWFGNESGSGSAGGEFSSQSPRDIGVNRSGAGPANQGDIYVADYNNHRIQRFDSEGNFISAWGGDVVSEGGTGDVDTRSFEICTVASECKAGKGEGDNATVATNEHKTITFNQAGPSFVAGDTFKLGNLPGSCSESETETIEFVQNAGQMVSRIVEAWEAKCGAGGISGFSGPFNPQFDFSGPWAETNIPTLSCTTISGGGVCADVNDTDGTPAGPASLPGNGVLNHPESVAVDNDTGNVYVSDRDNKRVDEYSGVGTFIRSFGWDVVASGPDDTGTEYEICEQEEGDLCKAGVGGATGTNESQTVHFAGFFANDTFTLGNLPGSCSSSSTEPITFTGSAASGRENLQAALEEKCGAGNFSLTSGPLNPVVHFEGIFAETNVSEMSCTTVTGGGTCEITNEIDGQASASGTGQFGVGTTSEAWGIAVSPPTAKPPAAPSSSPTPPTRASTPTRWTAARPAASAPEQCSPPASRVRSPSTRAASSMPLTTPAPSSATTPKTRTGAAWASSNP